MQDNMLIPVPLGVHMRTVDDDEIINEVSMCEARQEYYRWTVNEATVAYYKALINEWRRRHGKKHIPRKLITREDLREYIEEYNGVYDEIKI